MKDCDSCYWYKDKCCTSPDKGRQSHFVEVPITPEDWASWPLFCPHHKPKETTGEAL